MSRNSLRRPRRSSHGPRLWREGDPSYRELCSEVAEKLLAQRELDEPSGAQVWVQHLGHPRKFIGAAHGSAGNFGVLIRALNDLNENTKELITDTEKFLSTHAMVEGDMANWQRSINDGEYGKLTVVHWCHGATGIITDLAGCIPIGTSPILDDLFVKAANLVWKAGPLEKGISLCHGTCGSALACLKMFERTGDELWLDRARQLAMFAVEQYQAELKKFGQARFSLWTGDLGLAWFLGAVLRPETSVGWMAV